MAKSTVTLLKKTTCLTTAALMMASCASLPSGFPMAQPRLAATLEDDGTSCYASHRLPFYRVADEAIQGEQVGTAVNQLAGSILDRVIGPQIGYASGVGNLVAESFSEGMSALITDISGQRERIQQVNRQFNELLDCRREEAQEIQADYDAGRLSRAAALERMVQLRQLTRQDILVARQANDALAAQNAEFELATRQAAQEATVASAPEVREERVERVAEADEAVQTNQVALNQSQASVDEAEELVASAEGDFALTG